MTNALKTLTFVAFLIILITPAMAANESMDMTDIENAKPEIPFGGDFFSMLISLSKFAAYFGCVMGIVLVLAKGPIANAMNDANMKSASQDGLLNIGKLMLLGTGVFILAQYVFTTYL